MHTISHICTIQWIPTFFISYYIYVRAHTNTHTHKHTHTHANNLTSIFLAFPPISLILPAYQQIHTHAQIHTYIHTLTSNTWDSLSFSNVFRSSKSTQYIQSTGHVLIASVISSSSSISWTMHVLSCIHVYISRCIYLIASVIRSSLLISWAHERAKNAETGRHGASTTQK
jgi:hypothetical protein